MGFVAAEVALEVGFGVKPHSTASAGCLSRLLQAVWLAEVPGVVDSSRDKAGDEGQREGAGHCQRDDVNISVPLHLSCVLLLLLLLHSSLK